MSDRNRPLVVPLVGLLLSASPFAVGAEPATETREDSTAPAITGLVADENGFPLKGALVSVFGKTLESGAVTAVTDEEGHFEVSDVAPGLYQLRAYLAGFMPSPLAKVFVEEGIRASTILMSLASLAEETAEAVVAETDEERTVAELKWILQHGRRNILRDDEEKWVPVLSADASSQLASFEPSFAVSGEFGVRGADFEQGLDEFPGAGAGLDARLAYARLFIPTKDEGRWLVSAQLLESALSSWAGRAEYSTGRIADHTLTGGVTYGNYVYGDVDQYRPPEAALARRPEGGSTEWFGSAYASDSFLLGSTAVTAGLSFQYFDYLERPAYWAPSFQVSQPLGGDNTILRGGIDYLIQAPGGEDIGLLSKVAYSDVYGPSRGEGRLHAETTTRVQLGVEQQLSESTRVAVQVFQETANDQLVKRFTPERGSSGGTFRVSNQGDFVTRGLGVSFFQSLGAVQGTLGYRFGRVDTLAAGLPLLADAAAALGTDDDIHDVTTTIATSIDRTRTRLNAVYRIVAHPRLDAVAMMRGSGSGREIDTRFSLQVYQLLPFVGWNGTRWELMVAVRDLFYEDLEESSLLDELSVIDAPRRVLGGVTVRF